MMSRRNASGLLAGAILARSGMARAQDAEERSWPDRPLRIVVPYAPGGTNDIAARLLAQRLTEAFSQPAVVENRPGAQAIIGTEAVARARPDGLTLLVAASGPIVFNPATSDQLPYDPLRDLAPVSLLVSFPLLLLVTKDSPYRTVAELVAYAKANPEKANYGSPAASMQLATELFNQRAGTRFQYVAYRGSAEIVTAVASGDLTMAFLDTAPAAGGLEAGRVRALGVTAAARLPHFPDVPTMAEAGFPDMVVELWTGLLAPAGTPASILAKLHAETAKLVASPAYRERMATLYSNPVATTPDEMRSLIAREVPLWRSVARSASIRMER
jgi:tripartite-type tricarboxylate transporter receptor subunit TctC